VIIAVPQVQARDTSPEWCGFERRVRQGACPAADHAPPGYPLSEKCPEKRSFFADRRRSFIAAAQAPCRPLLVFCRNRLSLA